MIQYLNMGQVGICGPFQFLTKLIPKCKIYRKIKCLTMTYSWAIRMHSISTHVKHRRAKKQSIWSTSYFSVWKWLNFCLFKIKEAFSSLHASVNRETVYDVWMCPVCTWIALSWMRSASVTLKFIKMFIVGQLAFLVVFFIVNFG